MISICNFLVCRKISLRTADVFPVVASLPPKFPEGEKRQPEIRQQSTATERWNRAEYNSYVICKKLGVIRWLDCPCENIWKLHFKSPSKQFLYVFFFCLLSAFLFHFPRFMLFSYLVAPLPLLSFQEAKIFKMFRYWCPYKIFQPLFLIHLKPLLSTFSLYSCIFSLYFFVFLSYFPWLRIESVHFCKSDSFQRPRFTAIGGYLKNAKSFGNFCDVVVPEGRVHQTWRSNRWYKEYPQPLVLIIRLLPANFKTEDEEEVWISFCDS